MMLDKIKKLLDVTGKLPSEGKVRANVKRQKPNTKKPTELPAQKAKKSKANKTAEDPDKARATKRGEAWVKVLSMELNKADPGQGAFELDWNDIFVAHLIKAGYQGRTDQDIVDNWFKAVCRNVVLETYEQEQADPELRRTNNRRDLGDGRTEIS